MCFSGGSLSCGYEWSLPSNHPIKNVRVGVVPWMAEGDFHASEGSPEPVVLGWSRVSAFGCRHLGAQQPFPSGSGKRAPRQRGLWESYFNFRGACWCFLAGSPTSWLVLLQPWPAHLLIGLFFGSAIGEIGHLPTNNVWAFSCFLHDFFNYYLRG